MKFRDYVERLQELLEDRPELGDKYAVYACNDEGTNFYEVELPPEPGYMDYEKGEFLPEDCFDEEGVEEDFPYYILNAVAIN